MIFWLVWGSGDLEGPLRFNVAVDGVLVEGCEVLDFRLVDFEVMVSDLNSYLGVVFVWSWVV